MKKILIWGFLALILIGGTVLRRSRCPKNLGRGKDKRRSIPLVWITFGYAFCAIGRDKKQSRLIAAAHAHSIYGKAFSCLGRLLEPLTQDACAFFEDHGLYNDYGGVANDVEEGQRIAKAIGNHKAAILQNHGLLTCGQTVEEAVWWFITMERSCQAQLLAEQTRTKRIKIDRATALKTRSEVGFPLAGYFQFQPLLQKIQREIPNIFEE